MDDMRFTLPYPTLPPVRSCAHTHFFTLVLRIHITAGLRLPRNFLWVSRFFVCVHEPEYRVFCSKWYDVITRKGK